MTIATLAPGFEVAGNAKQAFANNAELQPMPINLDRNQEHVCPLCPVAKTQPVY
jgi:hypothetical protein